MKINKITKISAALACILTMSAHAGTVQKASTMSAGMTGNDINQVLSLTGDSLMREVKSVTLGIGLTKIRFQQEYKGVPVFGYSLTGTQTPMGLYIDVTGKFMNLDQHDISVVPGVSSTSAFSSALSSDNTTKASIYNQENDMFIYMVKDKPVLAHRVSYVIPSDSGDTPSRPVHFIDAQTGETLYSYENIQHAEVATGPGGNTKTGEYEYGTDFGFNDVSVSGNTYTMSNANVKTVNLNHGTSGSTAYSFTGPRNTVKSINGAYAPLNDAHFFGGVVFDMFDAYTGQAPLTFQLTMRVHYSNNYENAFWDGSAMTFGDGQSTFHPLVSLDVSAHEVSHGFTEQNSGLVYANMSGGMNEAFSDMSGEAAEYFMNGTNDFWVGEQIFKSSGALRYMDNPPQDGSSIDTSYDYYNGLDVHYSSGVFNKAFYNLATTAGWTTETAFKAMALANQMYWTANSTFDEGACGVASAATDLGYNAADVEAAFLAVDVACDGVPPPPPPPITELEKAVAVSMADSSGSKNYYSYETPSGVETASFNMSGGAGDADLYVKFGEIPTSSSWDCRPYAAGNTEVCDFPAAQAGTYYVMIQGYSTYSGASLVADHVGGTTPPTGDSGSKSDIDIAAKGWDRTTVEIPAGASNFVVSTEGGTGNVKLYLRLGANPTGKLYDCRSKTSGNDESCTIASPGEGSWVIGIKANKNATAGVNMAWSYE